MQIHCKHDKQISISELLNSQHPKNPNQHPDEQLDLYWKAIETVGIRRAVTVSNLSGRIVRGHGLCLTLAAYCEHLPGGLEFGVPVEYQDYRDEGEELADLAADNRIPELSHPDTAALKSLLDDLAALDAAAKAADRHNTTEFFEASGYSEDDLAELEHELALLSGEIEEEEPPAPAPPEPKPSSGSLPELIAKAAGLDPDEVAAEWNIKNTKSNPTPTHWSVNRDRRTISFR